MNMTEKNIKTGSFLKQNWVTILVLWYLVMPFDLIPEGIFPVVGELDDGVVVILEIVRRWREYTAGNK